MAHPICVKLIFWCIAQLDFRIMQLAKPVIAKSRVRTAGRSIPSKLEYPCVSLMLKLLSVIQESGAKLNEAQCAIEAVRAFLPELDLESGP
jgi:hypothetical protein